jgi:hypothetical protein
MTPADGLLGRYLLLGLLLGLRHALEADHVAAVTALATRSASVSRTALLAAAWGTGHAVALAAAGSLLLALDVPMPAALAGALEGAVGVMLIVLGGDLLRRLRSGRVHVHVHAHGDAPPHVHPHVHGADRTSHLHTHAPPPLSRALAVGGLHGLGGSAALVLLLLGAEPSTLGALLAIVSFGLGSIGGMVAFSLVLAWPLRLSVRRFERVVAGVVGSTTVALGVWIAVASAFLLGGSAPPH